MLTTANCRYCKGEVDHDAKKCRHCGEWLVEPPMPPPASKPTAPRWAPAQVIEAAPHPGALGWVGAGILALGTFLPFVSIPLLGGVSLWNGGPDGALVFGAAALVAGAHWKHWRTAMLLASCAALAIVVWDIIAIYGKMDGEMRSFVGLGIGAFAMLGGAIVSAIAAWRMPD
jgi:hypothetical protein